MSSTTLDRRRFLAACTAAGAGGLFPGVLWSLATKASADDKPAPITKAMIKDAARIAGVEIADELRDAMVAGLQSATADYDAIRALDMPNSVAPSLVFDPRMKSSSKAHAPSQTRLSAPGTLTVPDKDELGFTSVRDLSEMLRSRKLTSVTLTTACLDRLVRLDSQLHFVVTLLRERALAQARAADAEIARGRHRGPLHGIPWGVKDLFAVRGAPTTWGARGFETQSFDRDAAVVRKLDDEGAVLVAKLSLGALAMGDVWFGGTTRNPWLPEQGSSGSSAGSAAAVAAGCLPFAIGTETLGSISSPSTRCGVTGLRPTFGRVSRSGAMALSWSMDKVGAIARTAEDCALVLSAIHGGDGGDRASITMPFDWDADLDLSKLRIGKLPAPTGEDVDPAEAQAYEGVLSTLKARGLDLVDVSLPDLPWGAMVQMLLAEGAAAFDSLTRSGRDKLLNGQDPDDWPNLFRVARFIPAVEYVQASRARMLGMEAMAELFENVDVIVAPTSGVQLVATNLTGHPAVIVPAGFRSPSAPASKNDDEGGGPGTPVSVTFIGALFREWEPLAVAHAFQRATDFHLRRPGF
jgi:Asp-tRNA(Asn)/Glu-tRNA(Gln) amidotransferase A subunit family amidase